MRNITLALLLLAIISLPSCEKINELLTFTVKDQTTIRINSSVPISLPFEIVTPDLTTDSESEFEKNGTKIDYVKAIKLKELGLKITNPTDQTFSFLKTIRIYISTSSSDEIELAYQDNIPNNTNTITLIPTTTELDKYVKASSYKLRTEVVTRETLTKDIDLQVNLAFQVTADPF